MHRAREERGGVKTGTICVRNVVRSLMARTHTSADMHTQDGDKLVDKKGSWFTGQSINTLQSLDMGMSFILAPLRPRVRLLLTVVFPCRILHSFVSCDSS